MRIAIWISRLEPIWVALHISPFAPGPIAIYGYKRPHNHIRLSNYGAPSAVSDARWDRPLIGPEPHRHSSPLVHADALT